jgi:hypothetical protein
MAFWTQGGAAGSADPKRQYRFIASFSGLGGDVQWMVKNIDKPSVTLSETSHEYLNHTFYYPGRVSWNSISCTLVDPVSPDATATMMKAINDAGYAPPATSDNLGTVSKSSAVSSLGTVLIQQLAGGPDIGGEGTLADSDIVEEWKLKNAWIKSVTLSGLDYSGDSLSEVTIELRYDFATLSKHGMNADGQFAANTGLWDVS